MTNRNRFSNPRFVVLLWLAVAAVAVPETYAAGERILMVGLDGIDQISSPLQPHFENAGFIVDQFDDIAVLDTIDLSPYDVVWLANGVSMHNPFGPGAQVVPNLAGEQNLLAYLQSGGSVYFAGEEATAGQDELAQWRDAFISDSLGGGDVLTVCNCNAGILFYTVPAHPTSSQPNDVATFGSDSVHSGQFLFLGTGQGILYPNPDLSGAPVAAAWDVGDLANAPDARIVVLNNMNNEGPFEAWAVNVASWLAGLTPGVQIAYGSELAGPVDRCLTLTFSGPDGMQTVQQVVSFAPDGVAIDPPVTPPPGNFDCLTVQDDVHSLAASVSLSTGGTAALRAGNLNGDEFIDILDFGLFVAQYGADGVSPDTDCSTTGPHADFDADGEVGTDDFSFIGINFLEMSDDACTGGAAPPSLIAGRDTPQPITRITVRELLRRGLRDLVVADCNHDGWLDEQDLAAFLGRTAP